MDFSLGVVSSPASELMDKRVLCNAPEFLAPEPEDDTTQAEECDQSHIGQNRRSEALLFCPRGQKLGYSINPNVLIADYQKRQKKKQTRKTKQTTTPTQTFSCR